jgi:hypothetical protein
VLLALALGWCPPRPADTPPCPAPPPPRPADTPPYGAVDKADGATSKQRLRKHLGDAVWAIQCGAEGAPPAPAEDAVPWRELRAMLTAQVRRWVAAQVSL